MSTEADVIAHLRAIPASQETVLTIEQMKTITRDIWDCIPLEETITRPELAELTREDVCNFAAAFGQRRAQAFKRGRAPVLFPSEVGMLLMPSRAEIVALRDARRKVDADRAAGKKRRDIKSHLPPELDEAPVIVPEGYEQATTGGGQKRDVKLSLAALVTDMPSDAEFVRYHARAYPTTDGHPEGDHLKLMHWLLSNQVHQPLLKCDTKDYILVQHLLGAYDLLTDELATARATARTISEHRSDGDLTDLTDAAAGASWVHQGEFTELMRVIDAATRAPDNTRIRAAVEAKTRRFGQWLTRHVPAQVGDISEGQLTALMRDRGLVTDEDERVSVRADLRQLGLGNDLDLDVTEGVRARRLGIYDEFLASRSARLDGDPEWEAEYATVYATATA